MSDSKVEAELLRNEFYRDNYRKVLFLVLVAFVFIVGLTGVIFFLALNPPEAKYYTTTINGESSPIIALDKPNLGQSALLAWATQACVAAYTYNFVNYRDAFSRVSSYFTQQGWQAFTQALQDANTIDTVVAKNLIVTAVSQGAPIILEEALLRGVYTWKVQVPLLITYQSASQVTQQAVTVTLLITRMSVLESPKGIGIAQFIVSSGKGAIGG